MQWSNSTSQMPSGTSQMPSGTVQIKRAVKFEEAGSAGALVSLVSALAMGLEDKCYESQAEAPVQLMYKNESVYTGSSRRGRESLSLYRLISGDAYGVRVETFAKRLFDSQQQMPEEFEAVFQDVFEDILA